MSPYIWKLPSIIGRSPIGIDELIRCAARTSVTFILSGTLFIPVAPFNGIHITLAGKSAYVFRTCHCARRIAIGNGSRIITRANETTNPFIAPDCAARISVVDFTGAVVPNKTAHPIASFSVNVNGRITTVNLTVIDTNKTADIPSPSVDYDSSHGVTVVDWIGFVSPYKTACTGAILSIFYGDRRCTIANPPIIVPADKTANRSTGARNSTGHRAPADDRVEKIKPRQCTNIPFTDDRTILQTKIFNRCAL